MINNLLQPQITNQPGVGPHDFTQPVVLNVYSPTLDQNPPKSDTPQHFVLDNSTAGPTDVNTSCWPFPVSFDGAGNSYLTIGPQYNTSPQSGSGDVPYDLVPDFTCEPYQAGFGEGNISNDSNTSIASTNNNPSANLLPEMPEHQQEVEMIGSESGADGQLLLRYDEQDEKIIKATLKSVQSGSLTPLIKEELRCTIQSRRLAEGKGELKVEFKSPPRKKDMTEDERKRAVKRRLQNREAAQRFRQKQKDTSDYLTGKIRRLESASNNLISDLKRLKEERDELQEMLKNHLLVCTSHVQTTINVNPQLEEFLHDLHNQPAPSAIANTPQCLDSSDSCESVFFLEDDSHIPRRDTHSYDSIIIDQSQLCFEGGMMDDLNAPIDVFYEEVVEDESQYSVGDHNSRLDSISSVGATSSHGSYSPAKISLSGSSSNLRDSFQSENSRTHTNSSSSDMLDAVYMEEDFLLPEDFSS
ncbi:unnamed protein product [Lymnaea stagnalis]|uniref:BZIP domain-containing protein n=1 Tax=Lymnaea stagnalis TaxID=6523 RepID=A0AAV2H8F5_LYMST